MQEPKIVLADEPIASLDPRNARRVLDVIRGVDVLPLILGNAIYFFESNTRNATVLEIVGAGGIGLARFDRIRVNDWHGASLVILLILVTVYGVDTFTEGLRRRFTV